MPNRYAALVAETKRVSAKELSASERAFAKQLSEHFGPKWDVSTSIQAYERMKDVPEDSWPVVIRDTLRMPGMMGIHHIKNGRPFAEITFTEGWQFAASHDMLEMLVDPNCTRYTPAPSIRPGENRTVLYSVQVCDPSGTNPRFGYAIEGVRVANFCTPQYYDPLRRRRAELSQTGAITKPLEILQGGYLTWHDPKTKEWWQKVWWGEEPEYKLLGTGEMQDPSAEGAVSPLTKLTMHEMILETQQGQHAVAIRKSVEKLIRLYGKR